MTGSEILLANAPVIRLGAFVGTLGTMALWELLAPRRHSTIGRGARWPHNLGIVLVDNLLVRIVFSTAAMGAALVAESRGWGLFQALEAPTWLAIIASVIILDLAIYLEHVLFHAVPLLWRLHRVHHADLEVDVTTGVRHHPIEVLLSMGIRLGAVVALGAPAVAVLIFELLLNATSNFNHGNVRLPRRLDGVLRSIVVTPDMHRVHHSVVARETNSNFGSNFPWWDRLFGTYCAQPEGDHEGMNIGLEQFRDPSELRLDRMLTQPFRDDDRLYPLGRREIAAAALPFRTGIVTPDGIREVVVASVLPNAQDQPRQRRRMVKSVLPSVIGTLIVLAGAGIGFIYSGFYNVAAISPDNPLIAWAVRTTRGNSIPAHAKEIQNGAAYRPTVPGPGRRMQGTQALASTSGMTDQGMPDQMNQMMAQMNETSAQMSRMMTPMKGMEGKKEAEAFAMQAQAGSPLEEQLKQLRDELRALRKDVSELKQGAGRMPMGPGMMGGAMGQMMPQMMQPMMGGGCPMMGMIGPMMGMMGQQMPGMGGGMVPQQKPEPKGR